MRATLTMARGTEAKFKGQISTTISKVGYGTKKATKQACEDIMQRSLEEVPRLTNTLADAIGYEIGGHYKKGFTGTVGYCITSDPVNPKTGEHASNYVMAVHEDLEANHPVGKAKFLEDPVRAYAADNFPRTVLKFVEESLREAGAR